MAGLNNWGQEITRKRRARCYILFLVILSLIYSISTTLPVILLTSVVVGPEQEHLTYPEVEWLNHASRPLTSISHPSSPSNVQKVTLSPGGTKEPRFFLPITIPNNQTHNHRKHPHGGVLDVNGRRGSFQNPYYHLQNPQNLHVSAEEREQVCATPGRGKEGPEGAEGLGKIRIASLDKRARNLRVFCAIYTYDKRVESTMAILQTWGKRCDGLLFASTVSNVTTFHVHLPHQSKYEGSYKGMWQKVRALFAYMYDEFRDDFDYFHICGDDTFLIVENLKHFLGSDNVVQHSQSSLVAGFWMHSPHWKQNKKFPEDFFYAAGGSGYTLNRFALQQFVEKALPTCLVEKESPQEDVLVSWCFRQILNVTIFDTRDETGAHRYHQLPVDRYMLFPHTKKFGVSTFLFRSAMEFMADRHGFPLVWGLDYLSSSSIAFHMLKTSADLKRYEILLYNKSRVLACGEL